MIELNTNYHTHSLYCDGKEPLSAFVTAAEKLHYTQLGFSSHAPVPFENDFGIKEEEIDTYCQEIDELQQHTPVTLLKSLECDFIPGQSKSFDAFREEHHLDYIIGGVHLVLPPHGEGLWFIDGSKREIYDEGLDRLFGHNIRQAVTCFWEQTFEMIETEHFEIIAHFDKIKMHNQHRFFEDDEPWFQGLADKDYRGQHPRPLQEALRCLLSLHHSVAKSPKVGHSRYHQQRRAQIGGPRPVLSGGPRRADALRF